MLGLEIIDVGKSFFRNSPISNKFNKCSLKARFLHQTITITQLITLTISISFIELSPLMNISISTIVVSSGIQTVDMKYKQLR